MRNHVQKFCLKRSALSATATVTLAAPTPTTRERNETTLKLASITVCVALALTACGGGGVSDTATAPLSNAQAASAANAPSVAFAASAPNALPTYHMLPVVLEPPAGVDANGNGASAKLAPRQVSVPAELAGIATARLSVEMLQAHVGRAFAANVNPNAAAAMSVVYTPAQIRAAYGETVLPAVGATLSAAMQASLGAGQTIYIVDAYHDPNALSDLNTFNQTFGLPACTAAPISPTATLPLAAPPATCTLSVVYSSSTSIGMTATAPAYNSGWQGEEALDVQWAHATAPLARIVLIEASDAGVTTLSNGVKLANAMGAGVVSMSFGATEGNWTPSYDGAFTAQGMTYMASTGDNGMSVSWPSSSANVLAVGGTTLAWSAGTTRTEKAWTGTGGGISAYTALPAYQSGVTLPTGAPLTMRGAADVSFNADPYSGQYVVLTQPGGSTGYYVFGGTSMSSPQWAGLVAVANAQRAANNSTATIGAIQAVLYTLSAEKGSSTVFADVNAGTDGSCSTCSSGTGYDLPTGLGTPNAAGLLTALQNATVAPPLPAAVLPAGAAGIAYSLQWPATDTTGSALTYTLTGQPTGMAVNSKGLLSWQAPIAGVYPFKVAVVNAAGAKVSETATLSIAAPPTVKGGSFSAYAGTPFSAVVSSSNPTAGTLSYSLSGAPAGLSISATGNLAWASPLKGVYNVLVTAKSSSTGLTGSGTCVLTVAAPAVPPILPGGSFGATTLAAFSAQVSGTDPNGSALTYALTSAPNGVTLSPAGALIWTSPLRGVYALSVRATDGLGLSTSAAYTLTVTAPPVMVNGTLSGSTTSAFAGQVAASDPNSSALTYAVAGAPAGLTMTTAGALKWTNPVKGVYSLTVKATDAINLSATATYVLTISAPPVIVGAALVANTAAAFAARVSATDANGSALTFAVSGAPSGLTLSTAGAFNWPTPVRGVYSLTVTAKDALGLSSSALYTLAVNAPPTVSSIALSATSGTAFAAAATAVDPNGSALSYTVTGAPTGLALSAKGAFAWAKAVKGIYALTVTATDALGLSGSGTYTLTVR